MTRLQSAIIAIIFATPSFAANWEPSGNADVDRWYATAKLNSGGSCCGPADAYWGKITKVDADGVHVMIEDERDIAYRVPRNNQEVFVTNEVLDTKHQGNPTGHLVVFIRASDGEPICFFPTDGT